jgi:hypothetical protein
VGETNFEKEMNQEIEARVEYFEANTKIDKPFNKANYIGAFAFALFGLVLTLIAAF